MNFPLFIARKINGNEDKGRKVSKPAIRIATLGVAIGLAVMIVSVSVVLGLNTLFVISRRLWKPYHGGQF